MLGGNIWDSVGEEALIGDGGGGIMIRLIGTFSQNTTNKLLKLKKEYVFQLLGVVAYFLFLWF